MPLELSSRAFSYWCLREKIYHGTIQSSRVYSACWGRQLRYLWRRAWLNRFLNMVDPYFRPSFIGKIPFPSEPIYAPQVGSFSIWIPVAIRLTRIPRNTNNPERL
jgi:hypothetical protein